MNIDSFKDAFDTNRGSCRGECLCGKTYYNSMDVWTFEEGELERLDADPKALDLDCSVGFVCFEGKEYVWNCNCWHERAKKIMEFIDSHNRQIAEYINAERRRKMEEAERMPFVVISGDVTET